MKKLIIKINPKVKSVFARYPAPVKKKMLALRELIIETAKETDQVSSLEETLKWGEPSYLTPIGSTIRVDWKEKSPDQYAMYFQCTSRLVETFRLVFNKKFQYEGKRAIIFKMNQKIPAEELKACIRAALTYHKVKSLQTLGI
jgi:hypothetical protein